jgi:hypothetical protein
MHNLGFHEQALAEGCLEGFSVRPIVVCQFYEGRMLRRLFKGGDKRHASSVYSSVD